MLWGLLNRVMAWRILRDPQQGGHLSAEEILDVARQAGYDEETAQKIATRRGFERSQKNLPP